MPPQYRRDRQAAPQPGHARFRLRDATADSHLRVDAAFAGFDLGDAASYRAFLEAQYAALQPVEAALTAAGAASVLPDWPARRRAPLLVADLADLGAATPLRTIDTIVNPTGPAAILGAAYVLEGSRFGGAVLARRLAAGAPARFLGAAARPDAWRVLVAALDRGLASERELAAAVGAARAVFADFEAAAHLVSERALV